jgi:hypothetical protein
MTIDELSKKLVEMYENAEGEKSTMIHLFGIGYADEIRSSGYTAHDIIKNAVLSNG